MNWGEFKQEVEKKGVFDDTKIDIIDTSGNWTDDWDLNIHFNKDLSCAIFAYDKT